MVPSTTVAPSTTTAPTSTTPGQCDEYVASDSAYPVRRCEKGIDVAMTQMMLNFHGASLDTDGYFGPATEQAVRAFQANAGLEVDGLVGPDTFAALLTSAPPPVPDGDGNGTIDPWEMAADCVLDVSVPSGLAPASPPTPRSRGSGVPSGEVLAVEDLADAGVVEHGAEGFSDQRSNRQHLDLRELLLGRQRQRVGQHDALDG